jgi:hypothetical protein
MGSHNTFQRGAASAHMSKNVKLLLLGAVALILTITVNHYMVESSYKKCILADKKYQSDEPMKCEQLLKFDN